MRKVMGHTVVEKSKVKQNEQFPVPQFPVTSVKVLGLTSRKCSICFARVIFIDEITHIFKQPFL